ncbi:miraculin-like [Henckelia pumila]|uniref:miraculin-like n=1 Tax=Henckelia pumila TaxID=405737 RepID=UPI003C6DFB66
MKYLLPSITLLIFLHTNANYADYDQLYDTGMEHLVAGTPYYVVPVRSDQGGGLFSYEANATCYAVQQSIDDLPSQAVIFNHHKSKDGDWLAASKDLNIRFEDLYCDSSSSSVLRVADYDEATGQHFVTVGGVEGYPGCGTIVNWFRIEKIVGEYSYKLVYCPSVCDLVNVTCRGVGVFGRGALPRLVLSDDHRDPLLVRFQKAHPCRYNKF